YTNFLLHNALYYIDTSNSINNFFVLSLFITCLYVVWLWTSQKNTNAEKILRMSSYGDNEVVILSPRIDYRPYEKSLRQRRLVCGIVFKCIIIEALFLAVLVESMS